MDVSSAMGTNVCSVQVSGQSPMKKYVKIGTKNYFNTSEEMCNTQDTYTYFHAGTTCRYFASVSFICSYWHHVKEQYIQLATCRPSESNSVVG
jgi:hypothetical protein